MKKTAITLMLMASAALCHAQNAYDALAFSENNYEGTARTVAMGNAFTALGGDLGAVTINPAGSAVAGYSQFSITPALTFSTNTAQGVSPFDDGSLPYFEKAMKSSRTRFNILRRKLHLLRQFLGECSKEHVLCCRHDLPVF